MSALTMFAIPNVAIFRFNYFNKKALIFKLSYHQFHQHSGLCPKLRLVCCTAMVRKYLQYFVAEKKSQYLFLPVKL